MKAGLDFKQTAFIPGSESENPAMLNCRLAAFAAAEVQDACVTRDLLKALVQRIELHSQLLNSRTGFAADLNPPATEPSTPALKTTCAAPLNS